MPLDGLCTVRMSQVSSASLTELQRHVTIGSHHAPSTPTHPLRPRRIAIVRAGLWWRDCSDCTPSASSACRPLAGISWTAPTASSCSRATHLVRSAGGVIAARRCSRGPTRSTAASTGRTALRERRPATPDRDARAAADPDRPERREESGINDHSAPPSATALGQSPSLCPNLPARRDAHMAHPFPCTALRPVCEKTRAWPHRPAFPLFASR
jgi:hypothetical protein